MSQDINNTIATGKTRRVIKNLRWYVLVLFLLGVTVNYITRNSLGILAPELKESLGITTEQYSWIVGAFQIAYTIFQPLCGWLIDVIGLKIGFMVCAGIWALMCIFHAGAGSWLHLAILRFFMGLQRPPPPRRTPKPSANGSRNQSVPLLLAGQAWASPSARCWLRLSSTLLTPRSAGRARLCLPACWRCCG